MIGKTGKRLRKALPDLTSQELKIDHQSLAVILQQVPGVSAWQDQFKLKAEH
jgi:hypothetical protein